jgi:hypothetical protein
MTNWTLLMLLTGVKGMRGPLPSNDVIMSPLQQDIGY